MASPVFSQLLQNRRGDFYKLVLHGSVASTVMKSGISGPQRAPALYILTFSGVSLSASLRKHFVRNFFVVVFFYVNKFSFLRKKVLCKNIFT